MQNYKKMGRNKGHEDKSMRLYATEKNYNNKCYSS